MSRRDESEVHWGEMTHLHCVPRILCTDADGGSVGRSIALNDGRRVRSSGQMRGKRLHEGRQVSRHPFGLLPEDEMAGIGVDDHS